MRRLMAVGLFGALLALACRPGNGGEDARYQGVVELHQRVLAFETPGKVQALEVIRGQQVTIGQVLVTLDETLQRQAVAQRKGEAAAADAQLALTEAGARSQDVRAAEAQVRAARAQEETLQDEVSRARELAAAQAVPKAQLDDAEGRLRRATALRESAEQKLAALRAGSRRQEVQVARARSAQAHAALTAETERLARLKLRAPHEGAVLETHVEPGEVVAPGTPVVTLGDTTRPYVDVFVPQGELEGLRAGTKATVRVDGTAERWTGAVESVGRTLEFTPRFLFSDKERPNLVVRVRVNVADPEQRLHAGIPAFVTFQRGAR